MAPEKSDKENIEFLYACFKSTVNNHGKVDIASVPAAYQINVPAASMRLSRLRKALDSRVGQDGDVEANNDAADVTPKAPKTPKNKGRKATPASADKIKACQTEAVTPTPVEKSKKRKIGEGEHVAVAVKVGDRAEEDELRAGEE